MKSSKFLLTLLLAGLLGSTGIAQAQDSQPTSKPTSRPAGAKKADPGKYPEGTVKAEEVKITHHAIQAGEVRTESGSFELEMEISVGGQPPMNQVLTKTFERKLTVREVAEGKVRLIEIEFTKQLEVMEGSDPTGGVQKQERGKEVEGKTFMIERQADGKLVNSDEQGGEVKDLAATRELVQAGWSMFGDGTLGAAVSKETLKPGASVAVDPKGMKVLLQMPQDDGLDVEIEEFTYRGTREVAGVKVAVFRAVFKLAPAEGGAQRGPRMIMEIGGEILISVEGGRVVGMDMAGKMEFLPPAGGAAGGPAFEGEGVLRIRRTTTIKRP
ncbi:MAG: hypothetical protein JKY65_27555 [Planctomycetes bacterium]|nr:hypothetical protein [Planctomycetota bacterium]